MTKRFQPHKKITLSLDEADIEELRRLHPSFGISFLVRKFCREYILKYGLYSPNKIEDLILAEEDIIKNKILLLIYEWEVETCFHSSINEIIAHPNFNKLLSFQKELIIPVILNHFKTKSSGNIGLFSLILRITGIDPVPEEDVGKIEEMKNHWIKWGKDLGWV